MSTVGVAVTAADTEAVYQKCMTNCDNTWAGNFVEKSKCKAACKAAVADEYLFSDGISVEDNLALGTAVESILVNNMEAKDAASEKLIGGGYGTSDQGCAAEYVMLANNLRDALEATVTALDQLGVADFSPTSYIQPESNVGVAGLNKRAWGPAQATPGQNSGYARSMAEGVPKNQLTEANNQGLTGDFITKQGFTGDFGGHGVNLDSIFDAQVEVIFADWFGHGGHTMVNGVPALVSTHPYGWESIVGAFLKQVAAVVETAPTEENILRAGQDIDASEGETSDYGIVTSGIIGSSTADKNSAEAGVDLGSAAGILKFGAPKYWPPNSAVAKARYDRSAANARQNPGMVRLSGGNNDVYSALSDTSFSLENWAQFANSALTSLQASTIADQEKVTRFKAALAPLIKEAGGATGADMSTAAGCVYDADKALDNTIAENNKKLNDLMPGFWGSSGAQKAAMRAAIEAAKKHLINAVQSGSGTFVAKPEKLLFKEQCFLLSFVALIADYKKNYLDHGGSKDTPRHPEGPKKTLPYLNGSKTNSSLLVDGDPYGFLNKLVASPYAQRLMNIENWELSSIQPKIRLFKVIYDDNGNEKEVEISFDSHFSNQEMNLFKDRNTRGAGVGLKYFNFTYDGSNPFAAKKSIKAKINLFANSFQELLRTRQGDVVETNSTEGLATLNRTGTENYKYIELALKTGKPTPNSGQCKPNQDFLDMVEQNEELAKLNFRLKAVVGLSAPTGLSGLKTSDAILVQEALNDSFITLNLTPTIHEFDFDEQGRVNFTVNYLAYVEDFFDQKGFNIFADPSGEVGFRSIKRQLQMKTYQRDCGGTTKEQTPPTPPADGDPPAPAPPSPADQLAEIKKKFALEIESDQLRSVSALLDSMACRGDIYYVNVPYESVKRFIQRGPFEDYAQYTKQFKAGDFIKDNAAQSIKFAQDIGNALQTVENSRAQHAQAGADPASGHNPTQQSKNQIATALAAVNPDTNTLSFFYVSTLIDTILHNIESELKTLPEKLSQALPKATGLPGANPIEDTTNCDIKQKIHEMKLYKKNFARFRILMGPVEVVHQRPDEGMMSTFVNFGDIPVSVKYFVEWLATKVLQRNEVHYPLTKFLNDFFNNLIREFLNNDSCFVYNIAQKVRVNQAVVTAYNGLGDPDVDSISANIITKRGSKARRISTADFKMPQLCAGEGYVSPRDSDLPILNIAGPRGSADTYAPLSSEMNYFVFFAGRTMPTERQKGIRCEDSSRGIHHYLLGRDKGLIKNIKLSKTDSPGLAEVRFEQDGYDGLRQLRVVYDVQIDSFASVQTFPGTYIYVDPRGFDPSVHVDNDGFDLTDMGIGGYCMIVRSEHEFGEGYANSTIHAKWVASVDSTNNPNNNGVKSDSIQSSPGKCGIYARRQGVNASTPRE